MLFSWKFFFIVVLSVNGVSVLKHASQILDQTKSEHNPIAENNTRYRYRIDKRRSEVIDLASHNEAEIEIGIQALESSISAYE